MDEQKRRDDESGPTKQETDRGGGTPGNLEREDNRAGQGQQQQEQPARTERETVSK